MLELFELAVYVLQQFGVMLGVGAYTVMLCARLLVVHRGEALDARYVRAARLAVVWGYVCIVLSGLGAVVFHLGLGQEHIVAEPAFLFKWLLIAALGAMLARGLSRAGNVHHAIAGGTWYALFLIHSLGPVTSWATLAALYIVWMAVFCAAWASFIYAMRWHRGGIGAPEDSRSAADAPMVKS